MGFISETPFSRENGDFFYASFILIVDKLTPGEKI